MLFLLGHTSTPKLTGTDTAPSSAEKGSSKGGRIETTGV
jgi:hypothetical protein